MAMSKEVKLGIRVRLALWLAAKIGGSDLFEIHLASDALNDYCFRTMEQEKMASIVAEYVDRMYRARAEDKSWAQGHPVKSEGCEAWEPK